MVLTVSFVLSPVSVTSLVTVIGAMQSIVANLTPAKGHQDHTTSPSAWISLVQRHQRVHRIPHPNVRDDAQRPSERERNGASLYL
jgi:hypothetical protein